MNFLLTVQSFLKDGFTEWNGCVISDKLPDTSSSKDTNNKWSDVQYQSLGSINPDKCDLKFSDTKSYVYMKTDDLNTNYNNNTGCPLSDDHITIDESFNHKSVFHEENLLSLSMAQQFLSCICYHAANNFDDILKILPCIVFCDGHNNTKHIYMYHVYAVAKDDSNSKQAGYVDIVIRAIDCSGPFSSEFWKDKKKSENPNQRSVNTLASQLALQPYMFTSNGTIPPDFCLSNSSFSQYQLFGESYSFAKSLNMSTEMATISLNVSCNEVNHILEIDPQHISSVVVNVSPVPGDVRSPAFTMYKDVLILEGLLKAFGKDWTIKWAEVEDCDDVELQDQNEPVQKNVNQQIFDIIAEFNGESKKDFVAAKQGKIFTEEEDHDIFNLMVPREELDFTERIWDVLKFVQSFDELVSGLRVVMTEITRGRTARFWLHEDTGSTLGSLIKNSYEGSVSTPGLDDLLPVQILIELGLEKLKRDYVNFFFNHRFSTTARLDEFFSISLEDAAYQKLKKHFEKIQKLHHVVELATHCHSFLQLPVRKIDKIVRSALQDYTNSGVDFNKQFTFSVAYNEMKVFLKETEPQLWRMDVVGKSENGTCNGSACWCREFPFLGLISSDRSHEITTETSRLENDLTESEYYLTTCTESVYPIICG